MNEPQHRVTNVVSLRNLEFILGWKRERIRTLADQAARYYDPFDRQRIAGVGKWRHIDNPHGELRKLQRSIHRRVLARTTLPSGMFGGVRGLSTRENARVHQRQPLVVTLDLRNCFPTISSTAVFNVFERQLGFREELAHLLTKVTTRHFRLPQGAPTSTMLANLALVPLYHGIERITREHGLGLSFWIDDITISGPGADQVIGDVIQLIQAHGFRVPRKKLKVMPRQAIAQEITGAVVNRGVSAGSARIADITHEIFALDSMREIPDHLIRSVYGRIQYVENLRPSQARRLRRLADSLLPEVGVGGKRPPTAAYQRCKNAKRHRYD